MHRRQQALAHSARAHRRVAGDGRTCRVDGFIFLDNRSTVSGLAATDVRPRRSRDAWNSCAMAGQSGTETKGTATNGSLICL